MSLTLLKNTIKKDYLLWIIFGGVYCLYLSIIITLINPEDMREIQELYGAMEGYLGAFGISIATMTDPLAYTASTFYGLIVLAFTMVYYCIQNGRLIAKPVETGAMAYTLSMPISRAKVALTQGIYLILAMFTHALLMFATGYGILYTMKDFMEEGWGLSLLELVNVTFLLTTMVAMLGYFLSVLLCNKRGGNAVAIGVPILLLVMNMLAGAGGETLEWLNKMTPFGWLDSVGIIMNEVDTLPLCLGFGGVTLLLLIASAWVFERKQLAI